MPKYNFKNTTYATHTKSTTCENTVHTQIRKYNKHHKYRIHKHTNTYTTYIKQKHTTTNKNTITKTKNSTHTKCTQTIKSRNTINTNSTEISKIQYTLSTMRNILDNRRQYQQIQITQKTTIHNTNIQRIQTHGKPKHVKQKSNKYKSTDNPKRTHINILHKKQIQNATNTNNTQYNKYNRLQHIQKYKIHNQQTIHTS